MQRFLVGSRNTTHCQIIPVLGYPINQNVCNGGATSVAKCLHLFAIVPKMPQHRRPAHATVLRLTTKGALLKARDARAQGAHTGTLTRLVRSGELERVGPGRYRRASTDVSENHSLALASGAVPSRVVCLLSACGFTTSEHNCHERCG